MKKLKSMLLSLTLVLAIGLIFHPTPVRATDGNGSGPQNTSNSQTTGGSTPTIVDVLRVLVVAIGLIR